MSGTANIHADHMIVAKVPGTYHGWPSTVRRQSGELIVVWSGNRERHACPLGEIRMARSKDEGQSWSGPRVIVNTPLDDRGPGILELTDGTLVLNWCCTAFAEKELRRMYGPKTVAQWREVLKRRTDEAVRRWALNYTSREPSFAVGYWTTRSTDGGETWEQPVNCPVRTPHGPIQLTDGRLLFMGKTREARDRLIRAAESRDSGRSWHIVSTLPDPIAPEYSTEPHIVMAPDDRIVALIRCETPRMEDRYLLQTESGDGGHTWSSVRRLDLWGYPPHLLKLRNGWILATYGHRRAPFGQRACLSRDNGRTWDVEREVVLREDAPNSDLGYPASAELSDGSIYTVYYQVDPGDEWPCIMATHWKLPD